MELEITPQPSAQERAAIEAALADDAEPQPSPWLQAVLPAREDRPDEP